MNVYRTTTSRSEYDPLRRASGFAVTKVLFSTIIALIAVVALLIAFFLPAPRNVRPEALRSHCLNNLHYIGLALHNYASTYHALPPAYTVDENGKPLHSWRTLILPFLDEAALYNSIDLSKPWDDPANAKAYQASISVFRCPGVDGPANHTTYLAVVTSKSCLQPATPRRFSEISDNEAETVMVIEVDAQHSVHWMSPMDADESLILSLGPEPGLVHSSEIHALFVDGSVRTLDGDMPDAERRALISIAENEP